MEPHEIPLKQEDQEPEATKANGGFFFSKLKLVITVLVFALLVIIIIILAVLLGRERARHRSTKGGLDGEKDQIKPTSSPTPGAGLWSNVRLPDFAEPLHYDIHMNIDPNKDTFTGDEEILVNVNRTTSVILLHSNALNITDVAIRTSHDKRLVAIGNRFDFKKNFFHVIETIEPMTPAKYVFILKFGGLFREDLNGLYKGTYRKSDGKNANFAATFFEPLEARSMFPCFDEPAFKATFNMSVTHPSDLMALSNNALRTQTQQGSLTQSSFEQTPKMQTYLVSVVVGKFESKETTSKSGVKIRILARPGMKDQMEFALEMTSETLTQLEDTFGIPYPMPKLDFIALPECYIAMEDWGLIRFEEDGLLFKDGFSSEQAQQTLLIRWLPHEIVHMWFGNLVTMEWWDDLWLNEAFADLYNYFEASPKSIASWKRNKEFIHTNVGSALQLDGYAISRPVIYQPKPLTADTIFDDIIYKKGSSLLRMLRNTFPIKENFNKAIKEYLKAKSYGNAIGVEMWQALQSACPKKECGDIKEIMDPWMRTEGYPVLTVSKSDTPGKYNVRQERFVYDNTAKIDNNFWSVYFTYYYGDKQSNADKPGIPLSKWMVNKAAEITISWDGNGWLKGNVDQTGFYRVNYDDTIWKNLADQLEYNHMVFSESDRYGLIDDAFNLARGRRVNITQAFNVLTYLRNETDYLPWMSVKKNVGYILSILPPNSNIHQQLKRYLAYQSNPVYTKLGLNDGGTHLDKLLRLTVTGFQCDAGLKSCLDYMTTAFDSWKKDSLTTSITPALRQLVYYYGVRQGNQKDWEQVLEEVPRTPVPSEIQPLLMGLAGSRDTGTLFNYLSIMSNQSIVKQQYAKYVLDFVTNDSPDGPEIAWSFLQINWNHLKQGGGMSYIPTITKRFSTQLQLDQLTYFIDKNLNGQPMPQLLLKVLEVIRLNIAWRDAHEKNLGRWLTTFLAKNNVP